MNYNGYPKSVCTSVNEVVCHGIPEERVLVDGDILNVDVTCILTVIMVIPVVCTWLVTPRPRRELVRVARECMYLGIEQVRPFNRVGDIGYTMNSMLVSTVIL